MDSNTPVLNAAIAWGSAAEKKVNRFLQGTYGKRARDSMTPRDVSLDQHFTRGETLGTPESGAYQDSAMSQEIRPDEDQGGAAVPPPMLRTAFAADVWPRVDQDSLTTAEMQKVVEQSVETLRHTGHSDVDFGGDDADASGDQQAEPGRV